MGQGLDFGVVLKLGLLGGLADLVGDVGGIVPLRGETRGQLRGVSAQLLELADACCSAFDLGGEGLGGVTENAIDTAGDDDPLTLVDGCVSIIGYMMR